MTTNNNTPRECSNCGELHETTRARDYGGEHCDACHEAALDHGFLHCREAFECRVCGECKRSATNEHDNVCDECRTQTLAQEEAELDEIDARRNAAATFYTYDRNGQRVRVTIPNDEN